MLRSLNKTLLGVIIVRQKQGGQLAFRTLFADASCEGLAIAKLCSFVAKMVQPFEVVVDIEPIKTPPSALPILKFPLPLKIKRQLGRGYGRRVTDASACVGFLRARRSRRSPRQR